MSKHADQEKETAPRACPVCGKPGVVAYRPFCSKRCADIDLHRWLKGSYAIPAAPEAEDEEALQGEEKQEDRG